MRVIYNPNEFLKKFKLDQRQLYFNRIFNFILDLKHEKEITRNLIDKYKIKKIMGTEEIYKYYLDNKGMRLLFRYEFRDNQIFKSDSGIILLAVTNHDDQGKIGRSYDKKTLNFDKFIFILFLHLDDFLVLKISLQSLLHHYKSRDFQILEYLNHLL